MSNGPAVPCRAASPRKLAVVAPCTSKSIEQATIPAARSPAEGRGGGAGQRVTIGWATDAAACCASRASATHQPPGSHAVAGSRMVVGSHGSGPGSAGGSRAKGGGSGVSDGAVAAASGGGRGGRWASGRPRRSGSWALVPVSCCPARQQGDRGNAQEGRKPQRLPSRQHCTTHRIAHCCSRSAPEQTHEQEPSELSLQERVAEPRGGLPSSKPKPLISPRGSCCPLRLAATTGWPPCGTALRDCEQPSSRQALACLASLSGLCCTVRMCVWMLACINQPPPSSLPLQTLRPDRRTWRKRTDRLRGWPQRARLALEPLSPGCTAQFYEQRHPVGLGCSYSLATAADHRQATAGDDAPGTECWESCRPARAPVFALRSSWLRPTQSLGALQSGREGGLLPTAPRAPGHCNTHTTQTDERGGGPSKLAFGRGLQPAPPACAVSSRCLHRACGSVASWQRCGSKRLR